MCGTAGMFVGCAAVSFCPRALLAPKPAPVPEGDEYRSPFGSWYERSSVRVAPRRVLGDGDGARHFFSPDMVPVARHPLVERMPPAVFREVLLQHLYRYLDFTAKLEYLVVNRTVAGIAHGSVGVELPEEMRFDALKIYCDEAYHALFSADLARQARDLSGVAPVLPAEPFFLRRLREIQEGSPPEFRPLVELVFVIVSETLISATLADVPVDETVVPAVREVIRDHAVDEGRHHAYFAAFLRILWGQLDERARDFTARVAPSLIDAFLRPDFDAVRAELRGYGLDADEAEQVVAEVYPDEVVREFFRTTAQQTVRYFHALGVLGRPGVAEEFARLGLVDGAV